MLIDVKMGNCGQGPHELSLTGSRGMPVNMDMNQPSILQAHKPLLYSSNDYIYIYISRQSVTLRGGEVPEVVLSLLQSAQRRSRIDSGPKLT